MQRLLLLALVGASAVSAQDIFAVKACVDQTIATSTAKFPGSASCPAQCAHCHSTSPWGCPEECRSVDVFCACSGVMFQAVADARSCCTQQTGLLALACSFAMDEIQFVCSGLTAGLCNGVVAKSDAAAPSLIDMVGGALSRAAPSAALLQEGASHQSAAAYVSGHSLGGACLSLLDSVEEEHAKQADEMPDIRAAAKQIAERSSSIFGRELPALKDKLHRAMTVAWTESGPGMGGEEICQLVLQHHDSL